MRKYAGNRQISDQKELVTEDAYIKHGVDMGLDDEDEEEYIHLFVLSGKFLCPLIL